ncbi:MAG TPA: ABC transporter permease [Solirubrobacteraceae bacterium]|jgi:general nucleoside transport system permease protein|nr:ABC transporter permease [Solirubrobacteraceae bacterium]
MSAVAVRPPPAEDAEATGPLNARRVGWAGVVLAFLAFFVALPPLTIRSPVPTVILALAAAGAGAWAWRGGERRLAGGAIAAAVVGLVGGIAATRSGVGNLERVVVWSALFAAALRYATPLLFAALGGLFSERSGVINIGLEGMMLMGAFWGIWGADKTGSWVIGLGIGMLSGALLALIHAVFAVSFRADQIVSGFSMNFLAVGITGFAYVSIYGTQGTPDQIPRAPDVTVPLLEDIPFVGDVVGRMNILIWLGLLTVLLTWLVVFRTPIGLRLRSVGENPLAAQTAGVSPVRVRYIAVLLSGALAAIGGAYLSIGFIGSFGENMTDGRGFIALAVLICGRWMPGGALVFALLFGFFSALAQRLDVFSESAATLFQALPYVITLIAVAGVVGRSIPPLAIGRPLDR